MAYLILVKKTGLGTGWDISSPSYDNKSFAFTVQEANPRAMSFNDDGTKMYVTGFANDTVYQYSLSTAYDVSTASYDSVSFVINQDNSPRGMYIGSSGTKMFIMGGAGDALYQYTLSSAYDMSSASYDSVGFSVNIQENQPYGVTFRPDGSTFYVVGQGSNNVNQYNTGSTWNLTGSSYASKSFTPGGEISSLSDIEFSSDGTKMFLVGEGSANVTQYTLSTAWDVSTASYDSVSFDTTGQEGGPTDILFNAAGNKLYILGDWTNSVFQYSL